MRNPNKCKLLWIPKWNRSVTITINVFCSDSVDKTLVCDTTMKQSYYAVRSSGTVFKVTQRKTWCQKETCRLIVLVCCFWTKSWKTVHALGRLSRHTSKVTHQVGALVGFCSMKRLGRFLLPLDGKLVHRRVTPRPQHNIPRVGLDCTAPPRLWYLL